MATEVQMLAINASGSLIGAASAQVFVDSDKAETASAVVEVKIETSDWSTSYLSEETDPVLARIWNNEDDAAYDSL